MAECGEFSGFSVRPALSLFLNGLLALCHFGQNPETGSIYSAVTPIKYAASFMDQDLSIQASSCLSLLLKK
jgi:hypothetical protein